MAILLMVSANMRSAANRDMCRKDMDEKRGEYPQSSVLFLLILFLIGALPVMGNGFFNSMRRSAEKFALYRAAFCGAVAV
ncbi:MAG: hypothetical protein AAGH82_00915 [Pseudomonadota bacterium]